MSYGLTLAHRHSSQEQQTFGTPQEALGATRWDHQQERGFDFWVMRDPWENEFCILQSDDPTITTQREPSDE